MPPPQSREKKSPGSEVGATLLKRGSSTGDTESRARSHTQHSLSPSLGQQESLSSWRPHGPSCWSQTDLTPGWFWSLDFGLLPRKLLKASPGTQELPRNHLFSDIGVTGGSTDTSLLGLTCKCLPHLPGAKLSVNAASHRNACVH